MAPEEVPEEEVIPEEEEEITTTTRKTRPVKVWNAFFLSFKISVIKLKIYLFIFGIQF